VSRSLFHYKELIEDHLVSLLAKRTVKLSRPDAFNDPWDCRVHFRVPSDQPGRHRLVQWLAARHRKDFPQMAEAERDRIARNLMSLPGELEAKFVDMEPEMYKRLCGLYRVYCLSEVCDSPLMWAHYTDSHKGICLEFDALAAPFFRENGAAKVTYRATYPAVDITDPGYESLITKSDVWAYEREWRIVAEERAVAQAAGTIKTDNDFLTLPPGVLKSIIIGCLASEESRQLVASLVRTHAPNVLVRQATLARDRYDLVITPAVA
jgi:hypothetical protein